MLVDNKKDNNEINNPITPNIIFKNLIDLSNPLILREYKPYPRGIKATIKLAIPIIFKIYEIKIFFIYCR